MAHKKLINRTRSALKVVLTVRKGDLPKVDAGTVEVRLEPAAAPGDDTAPEDASAREVTYGSADDIYLNAIEVTALGDDSVTQQREVVVERGSKLDRALNTNDTIEFLWDGHTIRISAINSDAKPHVFPIKGLEEGAAEEGDSEEGAAETGSGRG